MRRFLPAAFLAIAVAFAPAAAIAQVNPVYSQDPITGAATQQQFITVPSPFTITLKSGASIVCQAGATCPAPATYPVTDLSGTGTGVIAALQAATNAAGGVPTVPVGNASIANDSTTVDGQTCTLGSSCATPNITATVLTASLVSNVALSNTSQFFDGPTVAQGTSGSWFVSGTVTLLGTSTPTYSCKLWDGTTLIASASQVQAIASTAISISLSGTIASPAGNLRISCIDPTNTSGNILADDISSDAKASTITAVRIN